jgi:hypothetical protein
VSSLWANQLAVFYDNKIRNVPPETALMARYITAEGKLTLKINYLWTVTP